MHTPAKEREALRLPPVPASLPRFFVEALLAVGDRHVQHASAVTREQQEGTLDAGLGPDTVGYKVVLDFCYNYGSPRFDVTPVEQPFKLIFRPVRRRVALGSTCTRSQAGGSEGGLKEKQLRAALAITAAGTSAQPDAR